MAHLKRSCMPVFWPLPRKKKRFAFAPIPGPHPKKNCIPLAIIVRDIFKLCDTGREAKKIIKNKNFLIDGREIIEEKFPIGLMDILTIKKTNENYMVIPSKKGFEFKKIDNAKIKYLKIVGKRILKKGIQLNLHDGRNTLLPIDEKDKYKVCDTLKFNLVTKKIEEVISYKEGSDVIIIRGRNRGRRGKIKEIMIKKDLQGQKVKVTIDNEDKLFSRDFIFVIPEKF
ncbi:MAG: 30S ribosomal protein S4e [Candidatus Aenigmarchaeota archaeon ex4484_56]|nr:MAG: 30S ribosomal protein S4e [Candidatus Aenigmarchaeota archaeon ex4484_56]